MFKHCSHMSCKTCMLIRGLLLAVPWICEEHPGTHVGISQWTNRMCKSERINNNFFRAFMYVWCTRGKGRGNSTAKNTGRRYPNTKRFKRTLIYFRTLAVIPFLFLFFYWEKSLGLDQRAARADVWLMEAWCMWIPACLGAEGTETPRAVDDQTVPQSTLWQGADFFVQTGHISVVSSATSHKSLSFSVSVQGQWNVTAAAATGHVFASLQDRWSGMCAVCSSEAYHYIYFVRYELLLCFQIIVIHLPPPPPPPHTHTHIRTHHHHHQQPVHQLLTLVYPTPSGVYRSDISCLRGQFRWDVWNFIIHGNKCTEPLGHRQSHDGEKKVCGCGERGLLGCCGDVSPRVQERWELGVKRLKKGRGNPAN